MTANLLLVCARCGLNEPGPNLGGKAGRCPRCGDLDFEGIELPMPAPARHRLRVAGHVFGEPTPLVDRPLEGWVGKPEPGRLYRVNRPPELVGA